MADQPTPNPKPLFEAARDHLRRSRASEFVLHDAEGDFYVAVGYSKNELAEMLTAGPERTRPYTGKD